MDKATDRHLVLTTGYLAPLGGAEQVLVNTALAARTHGYAVTVICREPVAAANQYARQLQAHQVPLVTPSQTLLSLLTGLLTVAKALALVLFPVYWARKRTSAGQAWQRLNQELRFHLVGRPLHRVLDSWLRRSLTREHARRPFSLLHGHRTDWAMPVVAQWAQAHGVPIICHEHSGMENPRALRQPPWAYTEEQVSRLAACTIAILSPVLTSRAALLYGAGAQVVPVPNWVQAPAITASRAQENGTLTIGTAGRLVERKGLEVLLEALGQAKRRGASVRAVVIGDGPLLEPLKQQALQWQVASQVEFTGALQAEEVRQRLGTLGAFTLVSESEGMPLTLLEALAAGLPLLATPVGAVPDLVQEGVNGFLVPVGDVEALAERLCELASQPERVERMGQASRELYLANYTEEAAWPKLSALYDGLITKGRSTS